MTVRATGEAAEAAGPVHPTFRGVLDRVTRTSIAGWAFDAAAPETRVTVLISANDRVLGRAVADRHRADLEAGGVGDGCHSFTFSPSELLEDELEYRIDVTRDADGVPLEGSPVVLKPVAEAAESPLLGRLLGSLDVVTRTRVEGWALNDRDHHRPVGLVVTANGRFIGRVLANRLRKDLATLGFGDGRHGFHFVFPALSPLIDHEIRVMREADGSELPNSPKALAAAATFDSETEQGFASLLATIESDSGEARALAFLARQIDRLLTRRADRESGRAARQAQALFRRRWGRLAHDAAVPAAFAPGSALRALVIDDRIPDAGRDAGSVAILSHMRALAALGYDVSFVPAREMDSSAALEDLEGSAVLTACGAPFYHSVEDVLKRQAASFNVVYLHRLSNARDYLSLIRTYQPKAHIIYALADLHHLRLRRQGEVQQRPELIEFSRHVGFAEIVAAGLADAVITHSRFEARLLANHVMAGKVHVVPWAISPRPCAAPFTERRGLAFIGQFAHQANPDAVFWLTRHVMPLVWAQDPAIRCLVVGHGWTAGSLPRTGDRIDIVGPVDDLADIFSRVRLTVAPLRFGAGIKGKVLESLAAGIPCVMSPVAAEGLTLPAPLPELVADGPEATARAILLFHNDANANRAAAAAGLAMIATEVSEARVIQAMAAALPA